MLYVSSAKDETMPKSIWLIYFFYKNVILEWPKMEDVGTKFTDINLFLLRTMLN